MVLMAQYEARCLATHSKLWYLPKVLFYQANSSNRIQATIQSPIICIIGARPIEIFPTTHWPVKAPNIRYRLLHKMDKDKTFGHYLIKISYLFYLEVYNMQVWPTTFPLSLETTLNSTHDSLEISRQNVNFLCSWL